MPEISVPALSRAYDELPNFLRLRSLHHQHVPADRPRVPVSPPHHGRAGHPGSFVTGRHLHPRTQVILAGESSNRTGAAESITAERCSGKDADAEASREARF